MEKIKITLEKDNLELTADILKSKLEHSKIKIDKDFYPIFDITVIKILKNSPFIIISSSVNDIILSIGNKIIIEDGSLTVISTVKHNSFLLKIIRLIKIIKFNKIILNHISFKNMFYIN